MLELEKVADRLKEYELELDATEEALDLLSELGYDPDMGARPLRRVIQNKIEDSLSDDLLAGTFTHGDTVVIDTAMKENEEGEEEEQIILVNEEKEESESPEVVALN